MQQFRFISINSLAIMMLVIFACTIYYFSGFLDFPSAYSSISLVPKSRSSLLGAYRKWDSEVGCQQFRHKYKGLIRSNNSVSVQDAYGEVKCSVLKMNHVAVLVKGRTWLPDNLDNLYSCRCGLSCLWTKSPVLVDKPDALLFETTLPPLLDILVYWSSSRCVPKRNRLAKSLLSLLPHHSFGKCLNNVGGRNKALSLYPECVKFKPPKWWDHLHCAMSHYKFVLSIENTETESYVTEKLFYALDSGAVPIYFGAPNVWDFVPPHSIIDGNKFKSVEDLATYVKDLANDPIAYAEYHAWRRCGVLGNYQKTRAASLDTLPCRLCEAVSKKGGTNAKPS